MTSSVSRETKPFRAFRLIWLDALFLLLAIGALIRLFHAADDHSEDFAVYWKAAHAWVEGRSPYAFTAEDHGFVFKYPPWILPLFYPLAFLNWEVARKVWFAIEVGCLVYTFQWVTRWGVPRRIATITGFMYWWLLHGHFGAGQFTLVLLAVALWACSPKITRVRSSIRDGVLAYFLSAKVFSLVTLGGIWRRFLRPGPWIIAGALFVAAHFAVLGVAWKAGTVQASPSGLLRALSEYYRMFQIAAASGGAELGAIIVRGQGNHGLTALVLRTLDVEAVGLVSDFVTCAIIAGVLGFLWQRHSRELTEPERWSGWIAVGLVAHPLAWHHSFVLAYPLCAFAIARAVESKARKLVALAFFSTCSIAVFVPQVIGTTVVKPLELSGMKSWGVVLAALALVLAARIGGPRPPLTEAEEILR